MTKFILKSVGFIILMGIALNYFSGYFKVPHRYMNTVKEYNALLDSNKEIDIAIYGSSHAYCSYNPKIIDSITKTRSFNFGNDAQAITVTSYVMGETLKGISPKLVVLDVYSTTLVEPETERILSFQKYSYDFFDLSFAKLKSSFNVFPIADIPSVLFPVLNRKDFILDNNDILTEDYVFKTHPSLVHYRGFMGHHYTMPYSKNFDKKLFLDFNKVDLNTVKLETFTKKQTQNINKVMQQAKQNGAQVLVAIAPYLPAITNKDYLSFHENVKQICVANNAKLVDLNFYSKEIGLTYKDFRDPSHVNNAGAKKVSIFLAEYIKNNYQLSSREKELDWIMDQPLSIDSYILKNFDKESIPVNKSITDSIFVESFGVFKEENYKTFILKLNDSLTKDTLNKYKMGIYAFLYKEDLDRLSEVAKKKNKENEAWNFDVSFKIINNKKYITKRVNTSANKFTKVKFFLFDKKGYKGIIGNTVEIDSFKILEKK